MRLFMQEGEKNGKLIHHHHSHFKVLFPSTKGWANIQDSRYLQLP